MAENRLEILVVDVTLVGFAQFTQAVRQLGWDWVVLNQPPTM